MPASPQTTATDPRPLEARLAAAVSTSNDCSRSSNMLAPLIATGSPVLTLPAPPPLRRLPNTAPLVLAPGEVRIGHFRTLAAFSTSRHMLGWVPLNTEC